MIFDLSKKTQMLLWQALFLVLGTSWLWASHLNPHLSYRSSLISQYETVHQPYSWLFRLSDVAAGLLVALAASYYIRNVRPRTTGIILATISAGLIIDPIFTTTCTMSGSVCSEYFSLNFVLHATETITTATVFLIAGVHDALKRHKLVSIFFVLFQLAYGGLFISQLADQEHFNTVSQLVYQTILIAWLAWFVRDRLEREDRVPDWKLPGVKSLAAAWAFLNGILAILISLSHLNLLGKVHGVYFSSDNAWLAQHGMIIGVVMLYLSRHLARGERRARQIFLLIIGIEVIKYSVIAPSGWLLAFYLATFVGLFLARDSFDRGTVPLTWRLRLKDLSYLVAGLLLAAAAALLALDRDNKVSLIAARSIDHFSDYIANNNQIPNSHLKSVLLAHSISAFLLASALTILWVLFKPNKIGHGRGKDYDRVEETLRRYSKSSEDYFKQWPRDKDYYWGRVAQGFIAYRIVGSTAFALADPIGASRKALVNEFNQWCRAHRLKACYLSVYESSKVLYEDAGLELLQIGSSAEVNIKDFVGATIKDKWWRWKLNQGKKAGYTYAQSSPPHSSGFLKELRAISNQWLKVGGHAERGFALGYYNPKYLQDCIIHYLKADDGKIIAFTNELPQFHSAGIKTVDLLRYRPETDNSMPFLLASLIQDAVDNEPKCEIFDLGFVPFAKAKGPLLAIAKTFSADRFSAKGLEQFKNKFNPLWQPNYMAYDGDLADLAVIALNIEKVMGQR